MSRVVATDLKRRDGVREVTLVPRTGAYWSQSDNDPVVGPKWPYTEYISESYHGWNGWDIPSFHRRVKLGELLPHTPYATFNYEGSSSGGVDVTTHTTSSTTRTWTDTARVEFSYWRLTVDDCEAHVPSHIEKYAQAAAAKLYSSGFDALTFVAELADVRHLFLNTAETLLKMRIPKNWKSMSNEWLSARYGWRTLFFDFKSLNQAIQKLNEEQKSRLSEKQGTQYSTTQTNAFSQETSYYWLDHVVVDKITTSLRGTVTADITLPAFSFNPFVTAWEVVPLSFVIDWFISVGKAISAASFLAFQSQYSASYGYSVKIERSYHCSIGETKSAFQSGYRFQNGSATATRTVRVPCSVPLTPHFTVNLNPWKILDLLGLIIQRLK